MILSLLLALSSTAFAVPPVVSDLVTLLTDDVVEAYFEEERTGRLLSVKHVGTARCLNGPNLYVIKTVRWDSGRFQTCSRRASVGVCGRGTDRNRVRLASEEDCETAE
jgi:hypothetical protein